MPRRAASTGRIRPRARCATRSASGRVKGRGATKYGVFFGDAHANVYGLDAQTGQQLWTTKVDDHFVARITAAPTFYDGHVYVPGLVVGRIHRGDSRLSLLHIARQRGGARRQHRRADLEDLRDGRAEAHEEELQGRAELRAGRRLGLEFAHDRSQTQRDLLRNGRRGNRAGPEDHRRHHGRRHEDRQGAVVTTRRRPTTRSWADATARRRPTIAPRRTVPIWTIGNSPILQTLARRQALAGGGDQGRQRHRARSGQEGRGGVEDNVAPQSD